MIDLSSCGPISTKLLLKALEIVNLSDTGFPFILNLSELLSDVFFLPIISFIIFHDFVRSFLLSSSFSSLYSFSLILKSEVSLLLKIEHSRLFVLLDFFLRYD